MSFKPRAIGPIPEEAARIARAAYPKGNIYLQLRDTLGTIYEDDQFADLFPRRGQPAETRLSAGTGLCDAISRGIV